MTQIYNFLCPPWPGSVPDIFQGAQGYIDIVNDLEIVHACTDKIRDYKINHCQAPEGFPEISI